MKRQYGTLLVLLLTTNLCFAGGGQILNNATPVSADVVREDPAPPQVNPGNNNGIQFNTVDAVAADVSVQTDADDTLDSGATPTTVANPTPAALEEPAFELTCYKKIPNSDSFEPDAAIAKRTVRLKQMKSVWTMNVYLNYCKDINPELLTRRKMVKVPVQTGPYLAAEAAISVQQAVD